MVLENYDPQEKGVYDEVELESVRFNKTFDTYATDRQTAFYILTPHFMEALMRIERLHPGNIAFAFKKGRLYLAIHNGRDTFPMKPIRKGEPDALTLFKLDTARIYSLVDDLKLNKNIT